MEQTPPVNATFDLFDMYIQMIIDEALFNRKKGLLEEQINEALDANNRSHFYELSKHYRELLKSS